MTDRELMQQALEALEEFCEHQTMLRPIEKRDALRERLAQPTTTAGYAKKIESLVAERDALKAKLAQLEQEPKLSCGVDYADGLLTVAVMRGHGDGIMEVIHCEQISMAQPEQEPVAYGMWDTMIGYGDRMMSVRLDKGQDGCTVPLYTAPPRREWVGLTDEEKSKLWEISRAALPRYATYAILVETKLKEKNI